MKRPTKHKSLNIPIDKPILLFDGVCNLCNNSVQFVIKRDTKARFRFSALQSETGVELLKRHQLTDEYLSTIVLIENDKAYVRSDAVLRVAKGLGGFWSLAYLFVIVPQFIRNAVYDWIGKNRYKWFGQEESCMMPTPELRSRFLN